MATPRIFGVRYKRNLSQNQGGTKMSKYLAEALHAVNKHHPTATPFQKLLIVANSCDDLAPEAFKLLALAPII